MSKVEKFFFYLFIFAGATVCILFIQKQELEKEYKQAEQGFVAEKSRLGKELSLTKDENKVFKWEKESTEAKNENLRIELERVQQKIETREEEYTNIKQKYKTVSIERDLLIRQLRETIGQKIVLKKEVENLRSEPFLAKILEEKTHLTFTQKKWAEERKSKEIKIKQLKQNLDSLEKKIRQGYVAEKEVSQKKELVQALAKKMVKQEKELFSLRQALSRTKQELKVVQKEKQRFPTEISGVVKIFEQKLDKIASADSLAELFKEVKKTRSWLASKFKGVELPEVIVRVSPDDSKNTKNTKDSSIKKQIQKIKTIKGKILQVDERYGFAIIDLGINSGLSKKDLLEVYQDKQKIAELKVVEVQEDISAANITFFRRNIKLGDEVRIEKKAE
ncbi:MAG: hypothetical protein KAS87_05445 [Candidatus Omnitrophica bacterium]|nr:hypothetical protein [Candidatus Omnitrophota bacterium]